MALTKRQKEFLDFFANFVEENGYCPSYEEIARGLDLSSLATVHKHVCALETKNYLRRGFNQSRSLELAPRYCKSIGAPVPQRWKFRFWAESPPDCRLKQLSSGKS